MESGTMDVNRRMGIAGWSLAGEFLPQNGNSRRRLDPQSDLIALDLDDRDQDVRSDHNLLQRLAAQDQHPYLPATELPS